MAKKKEVNLEAMVDEAKAERAKKAVEGKAKSGSAEIVLLNRVKAENKDISKEELVLKIYKGLGGLVDIQKAKINRQNEKKQRAKKASR